MATTHLAPPRSSATADASPDLISLARRAMADPEQRITLVGAIGCLGLLGLIFWSNLRALRPCRGSTDENYSHGFLVPLISLYFANLAARRGPVAVRSGVGLGVGLLAALARWAGWPRSWSRSASWATSSFLLGLAGLCALLLGTDALRRYWFAFFFLVFMVPLPVALYAKIASPLQLLVSQVASTVLNATGVPVLCEGNMMTLPGGVQMFVAEACSGMRQLTGFLALTAAVAYLSARPAWYRAAVVASAIPIAMTANVARVIADRLHHALRQPEVRLGAPTTRSRGC